LQCEETRSAGKCTFACFDSTNTYEADCDGGGCACFFAGTAVCSCAYDDPRATCEDVGLSCCPAPWH
jgi:hypothetical protein